MQFSAQGARDWSDQVQRDARKQVSPRHDTSCGFNAARTNNIIEGSLDVKLPTIWTDEKQRWAESEKRREEKKKEDQNRESLRRKRIQVREKVGQSRNSVFFQ